MATVSVIIPCFNQGAFVDEALDSVLAQTFDDIEIIVVNDGSTDPLTVGALQALRRPRTRVVHTANQGLPAARNAGIRAAVGRYILPLDADDRIAPTYIEQAVRVLEARPDVGIVYCRAELFGDRRGEWGLPEYQFPDVLFSPRIFAAALFRRADWEAVGGYSDEFRGGWEDYDFWLSLIERGCRVERLPEVLFHYRQAAGSMARGMSDEYRSAAFGRLFARHRKLYADSMGGLLNRAFGYTLSWDVTESLRLQMEALRADREQEIRTITGSLSWRVTRPIRWVGLVVDKARRGLAKSLPGLGASLWRSHVDAPGRVSIVPAGDVAVSGWCIAPGGVPADSVRLRCGGRSSLCARLPRADVAERLGVSEAAGGFGFAGTMAVRPGLRVLRVSAAGPGLRGRLLGARLLVVLPRWSVRTAYERWLGRFGALTPAEEAERVARLAGRGPLLSVVMPVYNTPEVLLRQAIESVRGQAYERWELCLADDASTDPRVRAVLDEYSGRDPRIKVAFRGENGHIARASNTALDLATGEFVLLLDHDDVLYPGALRAVAEACVGRPEAGLFYSDEDKITLDGRRHEPALKSDYDPDLLLTYDYLGHLVALRRELVTAAGGFRPECAGSQDWDLILRVVERLRPDQVVHIPEILYGWRVHPESTAQSLDAKAWVGSVWERLLTDYCGRNRLKATVMPGLFRGSMRIRYAVPDGVRLSLIVAAPTMGEAVESVRRLRRVARVPIVDAQAIGLGAAEPDEGAEDGLAIRRAGRSWMRLADQAGCAARRAVGDAVLCLSPGADFEGDDSVVELVSQAMRPGVGVVAPLEHHAGGREVAPVFALMRSGLARRLLSAAGRWDAGYLGRLRSIQSAALLNAPAFCVGREPLRRLLAADRLLAPPVSLSLQLSYASVFAGLRGVYTPHARVRVSGAARLDDIVWLGGARAPGGDSAAFCDPAYHPALGEGDVTWRPMRRSSGLRQFGACLRDPLARARRLASDRLAAGAADAAVVDILVPVYAGCDDTMRCLESVLAAKSLTPVEVVVVNDASPDADLTARVRALAASGRITLLENPANAGFVASVNRGLQVHPGRDVVLLNSDTVVCGDWVDRLRAAAEAAPDIGTATPLSNNATIFSYPLPGRENPMPSLFELADVSEACRAADDGRVEDVPTAVGFCMYIRRAALADAGMLDEALFGRGYGEENDLCCRLAALGWRNVAATGVYVAHRGCVSFGASRARQAQAAEAALRAVQQDYFESVTRFCRQDPLAGARLRIAEARLRKPGQPRHLAIVHAWGGGVGKHVVDLAMLVQGACAMLRLAPTRAGGRFELDLMPGEQPLSGSGRRGLTLDEARRELRAVGITRVHFHHFHGLPRSVLGMPRELGVPYDVTVHDFYAVCPRINLCEPGAGYCGCGDEGRCSRCLRRRPVVTRRGIRAWRRDFSAILSGADRIFAPSRFVAGLLAATYPGLGSKVAVVPHPDLGGGTLLRDLPVARPEPGEPLRVLVLGAVSRLKGADEVSEVAGLAMRTGALVDFHWLGEIHMNLPVWPDTRLRIHGAYTPDDLRGRLLNLRPHAVWMASPVPETYSYTLTEVLGSALPIVATRLGAFEERLTGQSGIVFLDPAAGTEDLLNALVRLRSDLVDGRLSAAPRPAPECGNAFYLQQYVPASGRGGGA